MVIEDVIEDLNVYIDDRRKEWNIDVNGHLVLKKESGYKNQFKAYKELKWSLWLVKKGLNYKILEQCIIDKDIQGTKTNIYNEIERLFMQELIEFIRGNNFYDIINGVYGNRTE